MSESPKLISATDVTSVLEWNSFIELLCIGIDIDQARSVRRVWHQLVSMHKGAPPLPRIDRMGKGVRFSWSRADRFLEIVVKPSGLTDWFLDVIGEASRGKEDDIDIVEILQTEVAEFANRKQNTMTHHDTPITEIDINDLNPDVRSERIELARRLLAALDNTRRIGIWCGELNDARRIAEIFEKY